MAEIKKANSTIQERVATLISMLGVSPIVIGKRLKVDARLISRIINEGSEPNYRLIEGLVSVYNVNPVWLITGKGEIFTIPGKLNKPGLEAGEPPPDGQRFLSMIEVLGYLNLWLTEAREECRKKLGINIDQEREIWVKAYGNPKLSISLKASIVLNKKFKYTLDNTLKIW